VTIEIKIGSRFDRLRVTGPAAPTRAGNAWDCICACGNEVPRVAAGNLRNGHTRSCGCAKFGVHVTHGESISTDLSPEYTTWQGMLSRCYNPENKGFKHYGGRGIKVADVWRHDYVAFLKYMGRRPEGHSIDRFPDNDGNYEPGNVRWATRQQQNENKRSVRLVTFQGERLTVAQWAARLGLKPKTLFSRLFVRRMPLARAMRPMGAP